MMHSTLSCGDYNWFEEAIESIGRFLAAPSSSATRNILIKNITYTLYYDVLLFFL